MRKSSSSHSTKREEIKINGQGQQGLTILGAGPYLLSVLVSQSFRTPSRMLNDYLMEQ